MADRNEFGRRVIRLRRAAGLTQLEAATRIGLSRPSLANIEAGRQGVLIETAAAIAATLGTTVSGLIDDDDGRQPVSTALLAKVAGQQREITKLLAETAAVVSQLSEASERLEAALAEQGIADDWTLR